MAFPTIPTVGDGRVLFTLNTAGGAGGVKTFPNLSSLTKAAGDLLIAIAILYDGNSTNAEFSSWGGSFTEFADQAGTTTMAIGAAYKWSTGSETGTFTVTSADASTNDSCMILLAIPGAHLSSPPEASAMVVGTAPDVASFDPSWGTEDTLWIAVGASGETGTGGSYTGIGSAPTNYVNLALSGISADAIGGVEGGVAFRQLNAASEDPGAWSMDTSNARGAALLIAVRSVPVFEIDAQPGSFSIGGFNAPIVAGRIVEATPAAYVVTGQAAEFFAGFTTPFSVGASGDDGHAFKGGTVWPPNGSPSADTASQHLELERRNVTDNTWASTAALRFDTSSIPDGATILSATLRLNLISKQDDDGQELVAEWYASSNWPIDGSDYSDSDPPTEDAHAGTSIASMTTGQDNDFVLQNVSNISKTGFTGIRLHITGGSGLTGTNKLQFASFDHASLTEPRLIVSYIAGEDVLEAEIGAFTMTGYPATLAVGRVVNAVPGSYSVAAPASSPVAARVAVASPGSFAVAGFAATFAAPLSIVAEPGAFAVTGQPATLIADRMIAAAPGALVVSGFSASLVAGRVIVASPGALAVTGFTARTVADRFVNALPGAYVLTGAQARVVTDRSLNAAPGAFAVSGALAATVAQRVLSALAGAYAVNGAAAGTVAGRVIAALSGAYTVNGVAADLVFSGDPDGDFEINAEPGAFSVVGVLAAPVAGRSMPALPATFILTGAAAGLTADRALLAAPGSILIAGAQGGAVAERVMLADPGAYLIGDAPAGLVVERALMALPGAFLITGATADLVPPTLLAVMVVSDHLYGGATGSEYLVNPTTPAEASDFTRASAVASDTVS